jgi:hypothetical protein
MHKKEVVLKEGKLPRAKTTIYILVTNCALQWTEKGIHRRIGKNCLFVISNNILVSKAANEFHTSIESIL